jgi:hypothetical protein
MKANINTSAPHTPWNKGKLVGQKAPLKLREIWAIRTRLQMAHKVVVSPCSTWPSTANCAAVISSDCAYATLAGLTSSATSDGDAAENKATSAVRNHGANTK